MTLEKVQRTGKDTFLLNDLGMRLSVIKFIQSGDASALAQMELSTGDKQAFYDTVRASVAWRTMAIDRASRGISQRSSALWMIPVIARVGVPLAQVNQVHNQKWVREYFGMHQAVCMLEQLPSYEDLAKLRPVEVHQLLERLIGLRETANLRLGSAEQSVLQANLPRLQFIMGTVSRYGSQPDLPDDAQASAALSTRLASSLAFDIGYLNQLAPAAFRVGSPMAYGDAIAQGMTMWLEEVDLAHQVNYWCLDADASDRMTLALSINLQGNDTGVAIELLNWQLGSDGIEQIVQACPWSMKRTFHAGDPRSTALLS